MTKTSYYIVFFSNLFASGLFYSFITAKLLEYQVTNNLLLLIVASVVELLIIQDILLTRLMTRLAFHQISLMSFLLSVVLIVVSSFYSGSINFYLLAYFMISLMLSLALLYLQEKILKEELDFKFGFLNMQLLRNLAKMLGFVCGIFVKFIPIDNFYLYLLVLIALMNLMFSYRNDEDIEQVTTDRRAIKEKTLYFLAGVYSTVTLLWIPLITNSFLQNGLESLSWLPFVLPGVVSILFIYLQKLQPILFDSLVMEFAYIPVFLIFYYLRWQHQHPIWQAIFFSLISALSISLGIKIRKTFLKANIDNNMKYSLQTLAVNSAVFSLGFSSLGFYREKLELLLLITACLSTLYMMLKKERFN